MNLWNEEAEEFVLGSVLSNPKKIINMLTNIGLNEDWFIEHVNRSLWLAMIELYHAGESFDTPIIIDRMRSSFLIKEFSSDNIVIYKNACSNISNTIMHVQILKDMYQKRELLNVLNEQAKKIKSTTKAHSIIEETMFKVEGLMAKPTFKNTKEEVVQRMMKKIRGDDIAHGIDSIFQNLGQYLGKHMFGEVTIIAGRPASGKTTLMCNEVDGSARKEESNVIISMEVSEDMLRAKMICAELGVDLSRYLKGFATDIELKKYEECAMRHIKLPIKIYEGSKTMPEIRSIIREENKHAVRICIDHLLLIKKTKGESYNKVERIEDYCNNFKDSITDTSSNLTVLTQLGRSAKQTYGSSNKPTVPTLEDLKWAGAIEELGAQIIFVYPDYNKQQDIGENYPEWIIRLMKNRYGSEGQIETIFEKPLQRFRMPERF